MSRWDSIGLMWEDAPTQSREQPRVMPEIPDTGWAPPRLCDLPNLAAAKAISIDCETKDPELRIMGPGVRRGAHIVGLAVGTDDGHRWYLPMRHEVGSGDNLPPEAVLAWAKDNLRNPAQPKVGTNLLYDLDFLWHEGVRVVGAFDDVQVAEPLLDELSMDYGLGALGEKYLGVGKTEELLYNWLSRAYGGEPTRRAQAGNIYRAPPRVVGPYAESDVDLPFRILEKQRPLLAEQNLEGLYEVERSLIPLLLAMRRRGVRVDVSGAQELDQRLVDRAKQYRSDLAGLGIDPNSREAIAQYCNERGIKYQRTGQGNASFPGKWLENHSDKNLNLVYAVRRLEKHAGTFLQGYILKHSIAGRIHCEFHQLKGDEYGTVSGRFSSSNPNLQNIPIRDKELGKVVRGMFLPDPGEIWFSDDWSQIEYRLLVHYGVGHTARLAQARYWEDPKTDFHRYVADIASIERGPAKNINFGLVYGMGLETMAAGMGKTVEEIEPIFDLYHRTLPFVKQTYEKAMRVAENRGYLITFGGRRRRFPFYESRNWEVSRKYREDGNPPLREEAARALWGNNIRRGHTNKSLNALLQGSAADIMKIAMSRIWTSGLCEVLGAPLLTVHDELNWSVPDNPVALEAHVEAVRIMETCVELSVPLLCESGRGLNWGEAH